MDAEMAEMHASENFLFYALIGIRVGALAGVREDANPALAKPKVRRPQPPPGRPGRATFGVKGR